MKHKLAFILGIRPDVIRAASVINQLRKYDGMEMVFIWSGQHYSDNLMTCHRRESVHIPSSLTSILDLVVKRVPGLLRGQLSDAAWRKRCR